MIQIEKISQELAESICRKITADLPEYFGLIDVNEHYAIGVRSRQNFAAKQDEDYLGLISIDFIYPNNANIYWMAIVGIGVGLYGGADGGYGAAQRLYVKRGYIPDGKGASYNYKPATPGDSFPLDDDLVLWLTKKLR